MSSPDLTTKKLVVVETHPIQYKAPLFRFLARDPRFDLTVLYAMIPDQTQQGAGFGVSFAWDIPLLDGYHYELLENVATSPSVTRFDGCDTPGIYAWLKQHRPDAVLVNGWVVKTCLQTLWACRRLGIPCLVRGEANLLRPRAWWKHIIHRLLLSRYQAWLYIGSANRGFYRSHHCPDAQLFFAPYCVDNEYFAREAAARVGRRDALRTSYGIASEACVFMFAGKLEDKKHPLDLLNAVAKLPAGLKERTHVLVVGEGPLRAAAESLVRDHAVKATFTGFLNQSSMPDAYAAADVLVLPSDAGETWGLVVNEAMASGRPVLVSHLAGCCTDLVINGRTGNSFACGEIGELNAIIAHYVQDPNRAREQGAEAARHISTYSFSTVADGVASALESTGRKAR